MQAFGDIKVKRWSTELPLFWLSILVSCLFWFLIGFGFFHSGKPVILVLGMYFLAYLIILFFAHVTAVAHIRGNGIKVTDSQLPEIHAVVETLSQRMGLKKTPETYILQGNGVLNAFATKFACNKIFVLYSNLLEAFGENQTARNMVIGHELGHIKAGHLRWFWFLLPSYLVPFLAQSLSRAREYTADRYGAACVENREDVNSGLIVLAAGKELASKVQLRNFAAQLNNVNTGWMRIGEWLSTHPVLVRRVCALDKSLSIGAANFGWSWFKGLMLLILTTAILGCGFAVAIIQFGKVSEKVKQQQQQISLTDQQLGLKN